MPVPVDDQRIHNEHIPETPVQHSWIRHCLRLNGLHEVIQLTADAGADALCLGLTGYLDVCLNRCEEFATEELRVKQLPTTEIPVIF